MRFYNRENELQLLRDNEKLSRNAAMFTVLMGRRRVGKTSLVTKAFEGTEYAYLFVSKDNEALLCRKFQDTLKEQMLDYVCRQDSKRNPQKIDSHRLQEKANYLPQAQFAKYQFRFEALSLEDM